MWVRYAPIVGAMALAIGVNCATVRAAQVTVPRDQSAGPLLPFEPIDKPTTQSIPRVITQDPPLIAPAAPLPTAIFAGPMTMAVAGYVAWRIRRRGGRI